MNIFIATDSRGTHLGRVKDNGWSKELQSLYPNDCFVCLRTGIESHMVTLFNVETTLLTYEDNYFDIAFIQLGYNEGAEYYSEGVFRQFFGECFNQKALIPKSDTQPNTENSLYRYWDKEAMIRVFNAIKKKCRRVVYIGFPSLKNHGKGRLKETAPLIDKELSKLATDYISFPQTDEWADAHMTDGIHFNEEGTKYISEKVSIYFHTFTSVFRNQTESNPHSPHHGLYLKALETGRAIVDQTKQGEIILLAKKSGEELYAAFIGAILFGRIPLVIQRPSPKVHQIFFEKRMKDLKSQVNASLCFCEEQDNEKFSPFFRCVNSLKRSKEDEYPIHIPSASDIAFIQMSSGTTGVSKICEVTHGQILAQCLTYGKTIDITNKSVVVSWLPLYHDMGLVAAFLLPIIYDAEFYIIDPFDWLMNPKSLLEMIQKYQGSHCWMPSFAFNYLTNKVSLESIPNVDLHCLKKLISCSEPTFCDDLRKFGAKFGSIGFKPSGLQVCYALAENVFAVSQTAQLEETEWKGATYASCGAVLPEVEVKIIRNNKDVTNVDDGEVWIKSPYMPRTNKCVDGWYNTGDIGFFANRNLHIIGRAKDMFVSYGVNVYPEIIEHLIANIEEVIPGRTVCFGIFSKEQGTNKVVVCVETENVTNNKLKIELSSIIREEFGLTAIVILVPAGSLIKTSSGKFCRIKNKEAYGKINA